MSTFVGEFSDRRPPQMFSSRVCAVALISVNVYAKDVCTIDMPAARYADGVRYSDMPVAVTRMCVTSPYVCRYEGIDAVKEALRKGVACSTKDMQIKINLISPPLYGEDVPLLE